MEEMRLTADEQTGAVSGLTAQTEAISRKVDEQVVAVKSLTEQVDRLEGSVKLSEEVKSTFSGRFDDITELMKENHREVSTSLTTGIKDKSCKADKQMAGLTEQVDRLEESKLSQELKNYERFDNIAKLMERRHVHVEELVKRLGSTVDKLSRDLNKMSDSFSNWLEDATDMMKGILSNAESSSETSHRPDHMQAVMANSSLELTDAVAKLTEQVGELGSDMNSQRKLFEEATKVMNSRSCSKGSYAKAFSETRHSPEHAQAGIVSSSRDLTGADTSLKEQVNECIASLIEQDGRAEKSCRIEQMQAGTGLRLPFLCPLPLPPPGAVLMRQLSPHPIPLVLPGAVAGPLPVAVVATQSAAATEEIISQPTLRTANANFEPMGAVRSLSEQAEKLKRKLMDAVRSLVEQEEPPASETDPAPEEDVTIYQLARLINSIDIPHSTHLRETRHTKGAGS